MKLANKFMPGLGVRKTLLAVLIAFIAGAVTFAFVGDNSNNYKNVDSKDVKIIDVSLRKTAPDLNVVSYSGKAIGFDSSRITVLNFWASWCAPCRQETPLLVELAADYPDIQFIGLTNDDTETNAVSFAEQYGITYSIGNGDEYLSAINNVLPIYGLPTTLIIDREGRVAAKVIGGITNNEFRTALNYLSAE
jgi:thiol-disulfide isomerase/thioredoxin